MGYEGCTYVGMNQWAMGAYWILLVLLWPGLDLAIWCYWSLACNEVMECFGLFILHT